MLDCDLCGALHTYLDGIRIDDNELALDAFREVGRQPLLRLRPHHGQLPDRLLGNALADNDPFETGPKAAAEDAACCAPTGPWKKTLCRLSGAAARPGIAEGLADFMARKKAGMDDAWY